jgi:pyruvate dehydrogenase E1 component alpha subunit
MAELFGKATGVSKGKGGSMHLFDAGRGFLGGYAIVAGHLPIAVGLAMAHKHRQDNGICLAFFGDGAVNEGEFHEALNLAAVWKTPVLFLCENNLYGMGTALERAAAVPEVHKRARAYNIPSSRCNGMDVLEMHAAARRAVEYVRTEGKPYLLEAMCYRFRGHSMADPELYREKDEVNRWRLQDPIARLREELIQSGDATEEELDRLDAEVDAEVAESVRFADESPEPAPDELFTDVYAGVARESHHG